jgi:hypothetical protein
MLKLLSFEIQKKWKMTLGVLLAYFVIYFGFYLKFKSDGILNLEEFGLQLLFFVLLGSALFFASVVGAVNNLRLEVKNSTRDLYFSIPMSSYSKIGSKVTVSLVEVFAAGIIASISATKAIESLTKTNLLSKFFEEVFNQPTDVLIYFASTQLVQSILTLLIVYLSFAIFRSFFSQIKFGAIITIVIYVGLNYGLGKIVGLFFSGLTEIGSTDLSAWLALGSFALFTVFIFLVVGYLFQNRVSFD